MEIIDNYDVISFDIFDTLLVRPYLRPQDLFKHIGILINDGEFFQERIDAELRARKKLSTQEDIAIDDIYGEIFPKYKNIKEIELSLEKRVLKFNPEIKKIYDLAVSKNKEIIVVSDMYMLEDYLLDILKNQGYNKIDRLYVSSAHKKTKNTGNLYKVVLNDYKDKKILHIGDNKVSDCEKAKENGIDCYFCKKIGEKFIEENKQFLNYSNLSLESSVILSILAEFNKKQDNYCYNFGYMYAGPLIYSFSKFVLDAARENGIEELLFISRDCYTLNKVFGLFNENNIKYFYVCAQRILKIKCFLNLDSNGNIDSLIDIFKNECEEFKEKIPNKFNSLEDKKNFVLENKHLFEFYANKFRTEYIKYIENLGIDINNKNKKTALVDTTAVKFSAHTLLENILEKNIFGIYMQVTSDFGKRNNINYLKYCENNDMFFYIWDFIEFVFASTELPVVGISDSKPIYQKEPKQEELKRAELYEHISNGAIDFCRDLIARFGDDFLISPSATDMNEFINCYIENISKVDEVNFEQIYCCGAGDSRHSDYSVSLLRELKKSIKKTKDVYCFKIFNINFFKVYKGKYSFEIYAFNRIRLLSIKKEGSISNVKLFNFIPLFKIKTKNTYKKFLFLGVLPVFKLIKK